MSLSDILVTILFIFITITVPLIIASLLEPVISVWNFPLFFILMCLGFSLMCNFFKWKLPTSLPFINDSASEFCLGLALTILTLSVSMFVSGLLRDKFGNWGILAGIFLFFVIMLWISLWRKW